MTVDEGIDISPTGDRGVLKRIIKEGEGTATPGIGCTVTVHYTGTLLDGTKFDSSKDRNEPFEFPLGKKQVIKAWDIGVATMKKGEVCVLTCAPEYAYGARGSPPKIPPNSTLQFEVEMIDWALEDLSPNKMKGILRNIIEEGTGDSKPNDGSQVTVETSIEFEENLQQQARRERINIHSRAYTAGWVARKILAKIKCKECKNNLLSQVDSSTHEFIKQKEYKTKTQKKLVYPSEHVVSSFGNIITCTNEYLEQHGHKTNISETIKQEICSKYSFVFLNCQSHRAIILDQLLKISIKLCIFNWCNVINKILKGTDIQRAEKCNLHPMQKKALLKYKKKLKNKKL